MGKKVKYLNFKTKAYSFNFFLSSLLIISGILSLLFLLLKNEIAVDNRYYRSFRAIDLYQSAFNYALSLNASIDTNFIFQDLQISNELVEVSIIPWASYYVLNLNFPDSSLVKFNRSFLINPQLLSGSASPTLYLADNQISINVLEDVQLSGSIFVPDAKMNNITDDLNSKVNLHQSTPTLPLLRPELEILKEYTPIPKDNRVKLLNTSEQRVKNSFREATLILYCNGMDTLKNMDLSNNIILISERHIVIDKSCQLDNIIVHAPTIEVLDNFKGQAHFIVQDSIRFGKNLKLSNSSIVISNPQKKGIHFKDHSEISGNVIVFQNTENLNPLVISDRLTTFTGQMYVEGAINLMGHFSASVIATSTLTFNSQKIMGNSLRNLSIEPFWDGSSLTRYTQLREH